MQYSDHSIARSTYKAKTIRKLLYWLEQNNFKVLNILLAIKFTGLLLVKGFRNNSNMSGGQNIHFAKLTDCKEVLVEYMKNIWSQ